MVIPVSDALIYYTFLLIATGGAWFFSDKGEWFRKANDSVFYALSCIILVIWSFIFALVSIAIGVSWLQS